MELDSKSINKKKVLVLGAFDLIHPGHVYFLSKAKEKGDFLVVGLFDDLLVSKLKGEKRPIISYGEREEILLSFEPVNSVVPVSNIAEFLKKNSFNLIAIGEGDNYFPKDYIKSFKGEIFVIERFGDYSTSSVIKKIKKTFQ